jgi:hypothetical protein
MLCDIYDVGQREAPYLEISPSMNSYNEPKLVVHVMLPPSAVILRSSYTMRNLRNYLLEVYIALDTNVDGSAPVQFLLPCTSAIIVASLGAPPISNLTRKPQPTVAYTCTNFERTSCHCPTKTVPCLVALDASGQPPAYIRLTTLFSSPRCATAAIFTSFPIRLKRTRLICAEARQASATVLDPSTPVWARFSPTQD